MLKTGLTSITFRQLSVDEVIDVACQARLNGIEWCSDVHVPEGDISIAEDVRRKTEAAGLAVSSYGSYFRCDTEAGAFQPFLDSAKALAAPVIRVWAGRKGSAEADVAYRAEVVAALRQAVDLAESEGTLIGLEYHGGTLTDTRESAHALIAEVERSTLKLYWQPRNNSSPEHDRDELRAALPHLAHVHVFHWGPGGFKERYSLEEGKTDWKSYLAIIRAATNESWLLFEFVRNDDPEQLLRDAATLHALIEECKQTKNF